MAEVFDSSNEAVSARVRRLRRALNYSSGAAFAARLGIQATRYNNIENGHPLSKDVAIRIVQRVPGMTLDWLYFGRMAGLPMALVELIEAEPNEEAAGAPATGKTTTRP